MAKFVPQREYMVVSNEVDIGSFGAGPCTIMILYNDTSRLVSHLDATTDLENFKIQVQKYLLDKDPIDINILFTDSGDPNNLILREKLEKSLKEIGLDNVITLIEDTQVVLTSKNKILTKFEPKKIFNLNNFNNNLGEELINQARKFKKKVDKFAKSRRGMEGVDEFGRQNQNFKGNSGLGYTYNYNLGKWVYNPDSSRQIQMVKTKSFEPLKFEEMRQKSNPSLEPLKFEEIGRNKNISYMGLGEDEKYLGPKLNNTVISKPKTKRKKKSFKKPKTFKKKKFNFRFKDTNHRQRGRPTKKMRRKKGKK